MNDKIKASDLSKIFLLNYIEKQLSFFFPDGNDYNIQLKSIIDEAIERQLYSLKYVKVVSHQIFSHLHSDLYAQFIYYLSNTAWKNNYIDLAQKLFYLNKSLHSINCMYDTELPSIFLFFHSVGSVIGKAKYSNYLTVNQNVTIGANNNNVPTIKEGVMLRPNSAVIGNSIINKYSSLSINALVFEEEIPAFSIVIGSSPNLVIKKSKRLFIEDVYYF